MPNQGLLVWGINIVGQLGLNYISPNLVTSPTMLDANTAQTWTAISAGGAGQSDGHSVAIADDGSLWAWGRNNYGQLGLGDTADRSSPVQVGAATDWQMVSVGLDGATALKTDGTLWTWGRNTFGQSGLNDVIARSSPTQVGAISSWRHVSGKHRSVTAIREDGSVWGWGANDLGQLGIGDIRHRSQPVKIGTLKDWTSTATHQHTVALKSDGAMWSWGYNNSGQLGQGDTANRSSPTQIGTDVNWRSVDVDNISSIAVKTVDTLYTWGNNNSGKLGLGDTAFRSVPVQVGVLTNWDHGTIGSGTALAVKTDGTLWGWGFNGYAVVNGDAIDRSSPVQIGTKNYWKQISIGGISYHILATFRTRFTSTESIRAEIDPLPGSGPIRGLHIFDGKAIAFRDNTAGTEGVMWRSTSDGWVQVDLGWTLEFTSGGMPGITEGDVIYGNTSGASAVVGRVIITGGAFVDGDAVGRLILRSQTGMFQSETLNTAFATDVGTIAANSIVNALLPGGSYNFVNYNFYGATDRFRAYGCNGLNTGFEWDGSVFVPILTGMDDDAPTHVATHYNHLFFSFAGGSVQHSGIGDPYTWTPVSGAAEISIGQDVTGMLSQTNVLTIFGTNNISALYGKNSGDWELKILSRESGAIAGTVQHMTEPVFMDDAGVRTLSAAQDFGDFMVGTITTLIEPLLKIKRLAGVTPTSSVRVRSKNRYRLFFSDGSALSFYIDAKKVQIMPIDYGMTVYATASGEDAYGFDFVLFGCTDGYVYRMDTGPSFDGGTVSAHMQFAYNHLGSPTLSKRWHNITFDADATPSTPLVLDAYFDYADTTVPSVVSRTMETGSSETWTSENAASSLWAAPTAGTIRSRIEGHGNNISVRVTSDAVYEEPFTLHGLTVGYSNRRVVRR